MIARALATLSVHGRLCLMVGLVAGVTLPQIAQTMAPYLPVMVGVLLLLTALRIGHRAALGALRDLRWGLGAVAVLQLAVPLLAALVFRVFGIADTPAALAMILATSAPAISGSANIALMLGLDGGG
ncbi:hypothetical protein [Sulfitobacter albidus]|uniref:hypothetical protein n=1 Tax=Sulfitobacter albidus TaxID=2829501 RepID=UPI0020C88AEC|nr:hypothetical protein [Sulfitobacter albidus]